MIYSRIVVPRDIAKDSLWSFGNGKMQETYRNIGMVARSDAPDYSTGAELQSMC